MPPYRMNDTATRSTKRPKLLTILCVLTCLNAAAILVGGIRYACTDAPAEDLKEFDKRSAQRLERMEPEEREVSITEGDVDVAYPLIEVQTANQLLRASNTGWWSIGLALVTMTGTVLMWRLRRIGFWTYVAANAGELALHGYFWGFNNLSSIANMGIAIGFTLVFAASYAVHLKHMH